MEMVTIRASSFSELFDCPARWESKHIKNMSTPSNAKAILGKAVHSATAVYDQSILDEDPLLIDDVVGVVADTIQKPDEDVDWGEDSPQQAENIGISLTKLYCSEIAPQFAYVAVEARCERLEFTDLGIALTGTTDRIAQTDQDLFTLDIKTGGNAVNKYGQVKTQGHSAQIAIYELLAEISIGMPMRLPAKIIGLQTAKTQKGQRCGVGEIQGTRELLLGDENSDGVLAHASSLLKKGLFYGNPRSMMCDKKYCPIYDRCKWRK